MDQIDAPKKGDDCRELWKPVAACAKALNALGNLQVNPKGTQNKLTLAEGNATLELNADDLGGAAADQWWIVAIDGQPMYCQFASGTPVASLPAGATLVDPS